MLAMKSEDVFEVRLMAFIAMNLGSNPTSAFSSISENLSSNLCLQCNLSIISDKMGLK